MVALGGGVCENVCNVIHKIYLARLIVKLNTFFSMVLRFSVTFLLETNISSTPTPIPLGCVSASSASNCKLASVASP